LRPPVSPGDRAKEGFLIKFPAKGCDHSQPVEYHKPDTCIEVEQGLGLEFRATAVCANGTNALIAGFKGKDFDPTDRPLENPFTQLSNRHIGFCVPTEEINSMTFWCDGLPGVDMRKPNPRKPTKGQNLASLLILGLVVAYNVNWHFRMKVKVRGSKVISSCRNSLAQETGISPCKAETKGAVNTRALHFNIPFTANLLLCFSVRRWLLPASAKACKTA
jgi:hypothetical protein